MNEFSGLHAVVWKFLDVRDEIVKRQFCDAELDISEMAEEIAIARSPSLFDETGDRSLKDA
jgi:hypothetical protein